MEPKESHINRDVVDAMLSSTFNIILRVEEKELNNRLTRGLTLTEIHAVDAIGYREANPMNVIAARLGITMATLTICINRLEEKGLALRCRDSVDRRKVLVSLTKDGRKVFRAHRLFHKAMVDEALAGLTEDQQVVLEETLENLQHFFKQRAFTSASMQKT